MAHQQCKRESSVVAEITHLQFSLKHPNVGLRADRSGLLRLRGSTCPSQCPHDCFCRFDAAISSHALMRYRAGIPHVGCGHPLPARRRHRRRQRSGLSLSRGARICAVCCERSVAPTSLASSDTCDSTRSPRSAAKFANLEPARRRPRGPLRHSEPVCQRRQIWQSRKRICFAVA